MRLFALLVTMASAVKLQGEVAEETSMLQMKMTTQRMKIPQEDGMISPFGKQLTDSMGAMDLDTVIDMDNEPDPEKYPGEDLEREKANEQATHFHNNKHRKIYHPRHASRYTSDDLLA